MKLEGKKKIPNYQYGKLYLLFGKRPRTEIPIWENIWDQPFSLKREKCGAELPGEQTAFLKAMGFLWISITETKQGFIKEVPRGSHRPKTILPFGLGGSV